MPHDTEPGHGKNWGDKHLDFIENEIRDIQGTLGGNKYTRRSMDMQIELEGLQSARRNQIWRLYRRDYEGKVKVSQDGTYVLDFQGAIPDL